MVRRAARARDEALPPKALIAHLRKFGRREFLSSLADHARRRYGEAPKSGVLQGDEPWLVAGVAALALMRCYPSGVAPSAAEVEEACRMYFGLMRPHSEGHELALERLLVPELYRQAPYQRLMVGEIARPVALFAQASWKREAPPVVIGAGWETDLLGCTIEDFCLAGFVLHAAAMNGSHFPLEEGDGAKLIHDAFGGRAEFEAIVQRHFVGDIEWFRDARLEALDALKASGEDYEAGEPYVFNPLVKHPLITGIVDGLAIAPAPAEVIRRASVEGIVHEGLARHGSAFTAEVGYFFEGYVGRQLATVRDAQAIPEIVYGTRRGDVATVDWIVVLPGAVLLVECKSALPRRDVVEGWETFREGHEQVIKARKQLAETAAAICEGGHSELASVPGDRPMAGLVVTLGSFYAANETLVVGESKSDLAVGVVDAEFLEGLVTLTANDLETFVKRMTDVPKGEHLEPRSLLEGLHLGPNPLLSEVFDSLPLLRDIPINDGGDG